MSLSEADKKVLKEKLKRLKQKQQSFKPSLKNTDENKNPYQHLHLGFEFALSVLVCVLGGYYLDKKFTSTPFFFLLGFGFGLTLGLYRLINATREG